jgi:hypothetical protein
MKDGCNKFKNLVRISEDKGLLDIMEKRRHVKKDLFKTRCFNLVLVCFDRGQEIPPRPEPYDVCFYVVEGSGTFTMGYEKADLSAGEIFLFCKCFQRDKMQRALVVFRHARTPLGGLYAWSMP